MQTDNYKPSYSPEELEVLSILDFELELKIELVYAITHSFINGKNSKSIMLINNVLNKIPESEFQIEEITLFKTVINKWLDPNVEVMDYNDPFFQLLLNGYDY